ncbi:unnamed protein product [Rotaria sp. Silwood2]|nr:unnamed protein product [Rotaria sp. Silwood2]
MELDHIQEETSERFYCSHNGQIYGLPDLTIDRVSRLFCSHSLQYSHPPLRKELCLTGTCKQINDIIDIFLLIHRNPYSSENQNYFDSRASIESFESPKVYQDFIIKDLIDEVDKRDIHLLSGSIQGTVITIPSTDITDHFVLPLTILQTCEHYIIDHPEISSDIPVYIY